MKPTRFEIKESFDLGRIIRSFRLGDYEQSGEVDLRVSYEKTTPSRQPSLVSKEKEISLRECVSFGYEMYNDGKIHVYFHDSPIYSGVFYKYTAEDGSVTRVHWNSPFNSNNPIRLERFDKDILERLRKLPDYVRDVLGM